MPKLPPAFEVKIDTVDDHGRGVGNPVGTLDGEDDRAPIRVTVPGAFTGERVAVRHSWQHKRLPLAHADLRAVLERHPGRIDPPCEDHAENDGGACRGCPLQSLEIGHQRAMKLRRVRDELGIPIEGIEGDAAFGYRWSAKRIVGGPAGSIFLGSRIPRSDRIADMGRCRVDHPAIVRAAHEVVDRANELGIEPFRASGENETGTGDLRYVWFKTDGTSVLTTLIAGVAVERSRTIELAKALRASAGVAISVQDGAGNAIRGQAAQVVAGVETLSVQLGPDAVDVGPLGFLQPNPRVAALAYAALTDADQTAPSVVDPKRPVFDLYAGAGVTTRRLRSRFAEVMPCEAYPESAAALGVAPSTTEAFLAAHLADPTAVRPSLIVANPPRGGMGAEVCDAIRRLAPDELRIMSCRPETLVADLERLTGDREVAAGPAFRLVRATAYDTLPHTAHLEVVAILRRIDTN